MVETIASIAYLVAIVLFIIGIKRLGKVRTARSGNGLACLAMLIAILATFALAAKQGVMDWEWIVGGLVAGGVIGLVAAIRVPMTSMPEMVALFNGSGGAASLLVALAVLWPALSPQPVVPAGEQAAPQQWETWEAPKRLYEVHLGNLRASGTAVVPAGGGAVVAPAPESGTDPRVVIATLFLSIIIGGITLTGSFIAYAKLAGKITGDAVTFPGQHALNLILILGMLGLAGYMAYVATDPAMGMTHTLIVMGISLLLGVLLVLPIGGADMPVVISLLNSYSGIAAAMTGFVLGENVLIVSGAMVGAAGLILTNIMCKAMNRSLVSVLLGGFGQTAGTGGNKDDAREYSNVKSIGAEEMGMMLDGISSLIVVPGYGLAVAQAQHAVRELGDLLEAADCTVRYAIHPVAGRMPGHMNVLLAEANIPYEQLVEMDEINSDFKQTDMVIVVGANDVVNPASLDEPDNPLYGMPILNVHEARTVVVIKRSLSPGYAGVRNKLFEADNAMMLFGDAKAVIQDTINEYKENLS
ncbi:MAG: NAD(P)(+) transhydrogenase (Re/Si-specific) subunit beta [Planctomycetes bacterium]|nr:NAD(P)(+) transhydrogenase (Re/Si-specific) subunit beta [Planctomycetota bacterium]